MKNKVTLLIAAAALLFAGLGCGFGESVENAVGNATNGNSNAANKTFTDKAVDAAVGSEEIGIAECDAVAEFLKEYANDPDDGIIAKAVKGTVINKIKEDFKRRVEENKSNKQELAKTCKEFKSQIDKYTAEQNANAEAANKE